MTDMTPAGGWAFMGDAASTASSLLVALPTTSLPVSVRPAYPEELAATYGWAIGFMESNPELKKLFKNATAET
jgi:hypothetical protein